MPQSLGLNKTYYYFFLKRGGEDIIRMFWRIFLLLNVYQFLFIKILSFGIDNFWVLEFCRASKSFQQIPI